MIDLGQSKLENTQFNDKTLRDDTSPRIIKVPSFDVTSTNFQETV